jgi:hypothetical protein
MTCILCRNDFDPINRVESDEHVFPDAIGGRLVIRRLCKICNDYLGSKVDAPLIDYFPVAVRREKYGLAGKDGHIPNTFMMLASNGRLVDDPDQKIRLEVDSDTGIPRTRIIPRISRRKLKQGAAVNITLDYRDKDQMAGLLRKVSQRAGKTLTDSEIHAAISGAKTSTINNPLIVSAGSISLPDYRFGLLKIVYELAWLWLGELWLDDPIAVQMRSSLFNAQHGQEIHLKGITDLTSEFPGFSNFRFPDSSHIALATISPIGGVILLRIFDVFAAAFTITDDPERYGQRVHASGFILENCALSRSIKQWDYHSGLMAFGNWELRYASERAAQIRAEYIQKYPPLHSPIFTSPFKSA